VERVRFIEHKGRKIIHLDFSRLKADDSIPIIEQARVTIGGYPPKSVFTLTDVSESNFNNRVTQALKALVVHNKPYVVASAVIGIDGLKQIIFNSVMTFSGRQLHAFDTLAEAKDWLASQ